jgi:phenylalanyl-tRNA synthetase beta chain
MGVVSNGMLCSGDELQLTGDADGILILPPDSSLGAPLADLFGDVVLDVDVKPNRGDALSIVGLAREIAAVTGTAIRFPDSSVAEAGRPVRGSGSTSRTRRCAPGSSAAGSRASASGRHRPRSRCD